MHITSNIIEKNREQEEYNDDVDRELMIGGNKLQKHWKVAWELNI